MADRAARVDFASWPRPSTTTSRRSTPPTCPTAAAHVVRRDPRDGVASIPTRFGICLATVDGYLYEVGDTRPDFTIQSISKAFTYGLALADRGIEAVGERIDVEPSGEAFHEISRRPDDRAGRATR